MNRHWHLLRYAALVVFLAAAPPRAVAGEATLAEADRLAEAGQLEEARKAYDAILAAPDTPATRKTDATYGLARLAKRAAIAASESPESTYAGLVEGFDAAAEELAAFGRRFPYHAQAGPARLEAGATHLAFVLWAHDRLQDLEELARWGVPPERVSKDAQVAAGKASKLFRRRRPAPDTHDDPAYEALASWYYVVSQYYRALVMSPCSPAAVTALRSAADDVETYVMHHDGQLLAIHAQDLCGLLWWEMAKCADVSEKKVACYQKAFEWFETCLYAEDLGPDYLRAITTGYRHIAEAGLDAGRWPRHNFTRHALQHVASMLRRHPTAWQTDSGLRALIGWADLDASRGNFKMAIEVATTAAGYARQIGRADLERQANRRIVQVVAREPASAAAGVSSDLLRFAADQVFLDGDYPSAIELYDRLIERSSSSSKEFLAHAWHALEHKTVCHRRQDDKLGEIAACEAIHEAWTDKLIPREAGRRDDPNLLRAVASRQAELIALEDLVANTGLPEHETLLEKVRKSILWDYFTNPRDPPLTRIELVRREEPGPEPSQVPKHVFVTEAPRLAAFPPPREPERREARSEVEDALKWLAAHQSPSGGWEAASFMKWCDGKPVARGPTGAGRSRYDVGVTGLTLCAFLGAGYTHHGRHPFARTIANGLRYLKNAQDDEGCFGPRDIHYPSPTQRLIYNQAAAALAMVEAYGRTGSPVLRLSAQRALDFGALARNPYFAWRYGVKPGDNDTSVTGWMLLPLQSARQVNAAARRRGAEAPLVIDEEAFDGARAWMDKMTDPQTGRTGYIQRGGPPARYANVNRLYPPGRSEGQTAVAMLIRTFLGEDPRRSVAIKKAADLCLAQPPTWDQTAGCIDMCYWFYATLGLDRVRGRHWKEWRQHLKTAVLDQQRKDTTYGMYKGSWDPAGAWGTLGGRVYATALMALCLESYFHYDTAIYARREH